MLRDPVETGRPVTGLPVARQLGVDHALSLGLTLVTNNVRKFAKVDGLRLDN